MHRLTYTNVRSAALILGLSLALLAGCDDSNRYPSDLRYPQRSDLLVKDPPTVGYRFAFPSPGHLDDAGIRIQAAHDHAPRRHEYIAHGAAFRQ